MGSQGRHRPNSLVFRYGSNFSNHGKYLHTNAHSSCLCSSNRISLIQPTWKDELYKYISTIISKYEHKLLQINGMPDHVHLLMGFRPTQSLSDLMQEVKQDLSKWINAKSFTKGKFEWQGGYGPFSYSKDQVPRVINYIQNQEKHHKKQCFLDEYEELLKIHEIEYDKRYISSRWRNRAVPS